MGEKRDKHYNVSFGVLVCTFINKLVPKPDTIRIRMSSHFCSMLNVRYLKTSEHDGERSDGCAGESKRRIKCVMEAHAYPLGVWRVSAGIISWSNASDTGKRKTRAVKSKSMQRSALTSVVVTPGDRLSTTLPCVHSLESP